MKTIQDTDVVSRAGFTGRQERKVLLALYAAYLEKTYWVDGMTLMLDYNTAARSRVSDLKRKGLDIISRRGKGATFEYRLTDAGYNTLTALFTEAMK